MRSELALLPPLLGSSQQLLNRDHREAYFSGMPRLCGRLLRRHGDEVQRLGGGYYRALGRCDDTMNLGGIKVGACAAPAVCTPAQPPSLRAWLLLHTASPHLLLLGLLAFVGSGR